MTNLRLALLPEVFHGPDAAERLTARLRVARSEGADAVVLPELPLDRWMAVRREPSDGDAESRDGPRQAMARQAARDAGVWLVAGAIVRDAGGVRHNTAVVFDPEGIEVLRYRKIHLPEEPGFWETSHYVPGDRPPRAFELAGFRAGIQICSDVNRPQGTFLLAAQGAAVIVAPRATEPAGYERWKLVFRANALTTGRYVISVNRPPEEGTPLGGPSIVVDPQGEVICETDGLAVVELDGSQVEAAARTYPGYLAVEAALYARGWSAVAGS